MPLPPVSPTSSWYQFINAPGTIPPPVWTLGCGFSVAQSNWGGSCSNAQGGLLTIGSNTSLDPTITTVVGSGSCNGQNTCSSTYGQPVTVTATVSSQYGPAPTGTVTLLAEQTHTATPDETVPYVLGTVPLSTTAGVTTGSVTTQLPPGQIQLSAIYDGDASSLMSAAMFQPFVVQNVAQPTTAVQLGASSSPVFGAPVTLTATVTPSQTGGADPTGSVRFGVGGSQFALGEAPVVTVNGVTTATLTTTALPEGTNTIYAVYSGDYNFGTSPQTSTTVTEATPAAPTHVNVTGPSAVAAGATYTATASTDGTGAIRYALAANPAAPNGMTIDSAGDVTFHVPPTGVGAFSYVVVAVNAAGRAQSSLVSVDRDENRDRVEAGSRIRHRHLEPRRDQLRLDVLGAVRFRLLGDADRRRGGGIDVRGLVGRRLLGDGHVRANDEHRPERRRHLQARAARHETRRGDDQTGEENGEIHVQGTRRSHGPPVRARPQGEHRSGSRRAPLRRATRIYVWGRTRSRCGR